MFVVSIVFHVYGVGGVNVCMHACSHHVYVGVLSIWICVSVSRCVCTPASRTSALGQHNTFSDLILKLYVCFS